MADRGGAARCPARGAAAGCGGGLRKGPRSRARVGLMRRIASSAPGAHSLIRGGAPRDAPTPPLWDSSFRSEFAPAPVRRAHVEEGLRAGHVRCRRLLCVEPADARGLPRQAPPAPRRRGTRCIAIGPLRRRAAQLPNCRGGRGRTAGLVLSTGRKESCVQQCPRPSSHCSVWLMPGRSRCMEPTASTYASLVSQRDLLGPHRAQLQHRLRSVLGLHTLVFLLWRTYVYVLNAEVALNVTSNRPGLSATTPMCCRAAWRSPNRGAAHAPSPRCCTCAHTARTAQASLARPHCPAS